MNEGFLMLEIILEGMGHDIGGPGGRLIGCDREGVGRVTDRSVRIEDIGARPLLIICLEIRNDRPRIHLGPGR